MCLCPGRRADVNMILFWMQHLLVAFLLLQKYECVKIIAGREAAPHSRPYMALLKTGGSSCGGTLIKDDWVLTAAHCKVNASTEVHLGVHSVSSPDQFFQQFKVSRWIKHCYDAETMDNDIQLVQLYRKAKLNKAVKPLTLPKKFTDVKGGTICEAAGWGRTRNIGVQISDKLMEVNLTVLDRETCNAKRKALNFSLQVTKNMMCTCEKLGGKDVCKGDSGGPLICKNMFRGIVSFGPNPCGKADYPSVYTFLTRDYIKWINKETKRNKI